MLMNDIYMGEAIKQAKIAYDNDEVPVGSIIVHKGKIVAKAYNQVEMLKDPTAHSEIIAITQATSTLASKWLYECTMYVTLEPCSMCAGALVLSRIQNIFIGTSDEKTGACGSVFNIVDSPNLNHKVNTVLGVREEECSNLLSQFFKNKRK